MERGFSRHYGRAEGASPESIKQGIAVRRWIPGSPLRGAPE
jgi:hypothetical protein